MTDTDAPQLEAFLADFGLSSFRPGQKDVISAIVEGSDCLCIMPTGGGKSLCYQLPALARPGIVLVVSPLIALMKDQVDSLNHLGLRATFINSSLETAEQHLRIEQMRAGQFDLVYIAPERLRNLRFLAALESIQIQLLAVDEAHCVSQWGHDFRPDYARLGDFRRQLGWPQTIALTATATHTVREDVASQLQLREPETFITGFARPNLRFEVLSTSHRGDKNNLLLRFLHETPGPGIIYVSARKRCEELVDLLEPELQRQVGFYHAGLGPDERRDIQDDFMAGETEIIVATNAFGMGINKTDLRFVVHYNMPGSLEAYYQEAGRAGRDGKPSRCLLLFTESDRYIQEFFIENAYPSRGTVARVYRYLCELDEDPIEITQHELKERLSLEIGGEGIGACEQLLEKCGALERLLTRDNLASVRVDTDCPSLLDLLPKDAPNRRKTARAIDGFLDGQRYHRVFFPMQRLVENAGLSRDAVLRALRDLNKLACFDYVPAFRGRAIHMLNRNRPFEELDIDFATLEKRKANEFAKLERVIQYARTHGCRQHQILDYFGDSETAACGTCDNCSATVGPSPGSQDDRESSPAVLEAVRIALSGVARVRGRVGKLMVAKMLCGSRSQQISKLRLDELSTYGLLGHLKQDEATHLLDALLHSNLIEQKETNRFRPVLHLTDQGRKIMKGHTGLPRPLSLGRSLSQRLAATPCQATTAPPPPPAPAIELPDPAPAKPSAAAVEAPSAAAHEVTPPLPELPDYHWTCKLLRAGFTLAECEPIRGVDQATLLKHLEQAAQAGESLDPMWVFTREELDAIGRAASRSKGGEKAEDKSRRWTKAHFEFYARLPK